MADAPGIAEMGLAAARLTRLATVDEIFSRPREALSARHPALDYLLHCHWCSGIWASAAVVVLSARVPAARPAIRALAVAQAASTILQAVDTAEMMEP